MIAGPANSSIEPGPRRLPARTADMPRRARPVIELSRFTVSFINIPIIGPMPRQM